MNNVIVLGKVVEKSNIHFDYLDKLKVYFKIKVVEDKNIFGALVYEKCIEMKKIDILYNNISVGNKVCIYGSIIKKKEEYIILCNDIVVC